MGSVYKEGDFVRVELDTYCGLEEGNQQTLNTLLSDATLKPSKVVSQSRTISIRTSMRRRLRMVWMSKRNTSLTRQMASTNQRLAMSSAMVRRRGELSGDEDLPYDYDQDGVWNTKSDGQGGLADNDIDGDGIANKVDHDMDNDGIPNAFDGDPVLPNVDWVGIVLGVLTLVVVLLLMSAHNGCQNSVSKPSTQPSPL